MAATSQKTNWFLDVLIFFSFLVAFFINLTGLPIHQWLGVGFTLLIIVHLINHWNWVKSVAGRFFGKISNRSRLLAVIDGLLLIGMVMIVETGLVISSWFNLELTHYSIWRDLHEYSSVATLALAVLKVGLHWRWIVRNAGKIFNLQLPHVQQKAALPKTVNPTPQTASMDRRQFMVMMGLVGLGSLLAVNNVLSKEKVVQSAYFSEADVTTNNVNNNQKPAAVETQVSEKQPAAAAAAVQQPTPETVSTFASPAATTCSYHCPKGLHCSFPGRCNRYIDKNNNGLCDNGECL